MVLAFIYVKGSENMIRTLRRIKGHSKLESIEFMLEKYYCELKEMYLIRRGLEQK